MKTITNIDLITKIIKSKSKKCIKYNSIKLNIKSNKIEIEGEKFPEYIYNEILDICREKYPSTKFSKIDVKNAVEKFARENKYIPEKQTFDKSNLSDWYSQLELDDKGNVIKNLSNIIRFFEVCPLYKGKFKFNEFTNYETFNDELIRDYNISDFRIQCEREIGYESKDKVECAVQHLTHKNSFNPFKDAIDELIWDGQERRATFFIDFIGAEDTELNKSMTIKWFYAMMKRLYEPGCPFDNMLIAYDERQGTGKSKIIQRLVESLGINYGYDTSICCDNKDKDNVDKLNKTWIVGIDEMQEFLKKNPEQTKQFLAQTFDTARLSYAKRSEQYLRHCVFYGNSNIEYFLKDYTSNYERRYWIMNCHGEVHDKQWWDENLTDEYCRQVLAEIKYHYDTNPNFNYTNLSIIEENELKNIQFYHKTLQNDDLLSYKIDEILNKKYEKTEFFNYKDFIKYVEKTDSMNIGTETIEFFGDTVSTSENTSGYIDKIPCKWLKMWIEEYCHRNISTQYIRAIISQFWYYEVVRYNGAPTRCFIRFKNYSIDNQ